MSHLVPIQTVEAPRRYAIRLKNGQLLHRQTPRRPGSKPYLVAPVYLRAACPEAAREPRAISILDLKKHPAGYWLSQSETKIPKTWRRE